MKLYVGNLAFGITEDELKSLFSKYGPVESVNLITDRATGQSKGFGFIEMERQADAEKAIKELNGSAVKGRNITVNQARPKTDKPKHSQKSW